jgi:hypothetical protein
MICGAFFMRKIMNQLVNFEQEKTFSSLYLVEQINLFREQEQNRSELRHSHFLTKVEKEFEKEIDERNISSVDGIVAQPKIRFSSYRDLSGKQSKSYELTYRQALNMLMSESRTVREHVMDVLEAQQKEIAKLKAADMPKTFSEALRMLADSEDAKLLAEHNSEELKIELDKSKEWFSIKKIAHRNDLNWKKLDWRLLKKASDVCGYLPKKIFDANFPNGVNAYHYQSWKIVYPDLRYV